MVYLFLGTDEISKERKLQQLKQEILKDNQDFFDYERLYAKELNPALLNELFARVPLAAEKRLVFIRDIDEFVNKRKEDDDLKDKHKEIKDPKAKCRDIILAQIQKPNNRLLLVLDTQISQLKDPFLNKIVNSAKVFHFSRERSFNAFDLADAIQAKRTQEALKIFSIIYQKGEHPTRILGGLFWSWRKMKRLLKSDNFKRGIELFLDTDINIKFSKLKAETAMEMLIVKLCLLSGG